MCVGEEIDKDSRQEVQQFMWVIKKEEVEKKFLKK